MRNFCALLLLCTCGCVTTQETARLPLPPEPAVVYRGFMEEVTEVMAPMTPKRIGVSWQHPSNNVTFNVYSAIEPSLSSMVLRTNTAGFSVEFEAVREAEFFAVRAVYPGGKLSPWGTK